MNNSILFIGIAGGSASGKTSFANLLIDTIKSPNMVLITQDSYYKNFSQLAFNERANINFDHPDSIDYKLLKNHLKNLLEGKKVDIPIYDYTSHLRKEITRTINNHKIIILEGILALYDKEIRNMMDIKLYIDTDDDIRIIRRIKRDMNIRQRTFESIVKQYYNTVKPMHNQFVEPTKQYADIVLIGGGKNQIAIDIIKNQIMRIL